MSIERHYGFMWDQAVELCQEAERLHRRFLRYLGPQSEEPTWEAPVDIQETRGGFVLLFALPGVAEEDIQLRLERGQLSVSAVRRLRAAESGAVIRRLEIPYGRFVRQVALSATGLELQAARYHGGCLEVRLARASGGE